MSRFTAMCTLTATLFLAVAARTVYAEEPLVLVQTIQLKGVEGKLDHLAVDSKGQRLFVANKINNTLDVVDLKTGKLVTQIPDQGKVSGVAFAGDLDMVYVGNGSGVCNGFDCKTFKEVFSTKAPGADNVHYHSGNHMVYVAQDEAISVLDAKTGEVKAAIKMPGSTHGFKIDKKAAKLFVVLAKPNQIGVIDLNKNELLEKFPLSDAGSPIAYDAKNGLLFVGYSKGAKVVALDAKTGKELAAIAIPAGIDDLHFDSKRNRLYASCSDSALIVIEKKGENYEVIAKIETPKLSKTSAWSSNKLFLGVPKQGGKEGPEVRVFEARPVIEAKSSGEEKK